MSCTCDRGEVYFIWALWGGATSLLSSEGRALLYCHLYYDLFVIFSLRDVRIYIKSPFTFRKIQHDPEFHSIHSRQRPVCDNVAIIKNYKCHDDLDKTAE